MSKYKDKFGWIVLFNLGDQSSNKCKYFEPSEPAQFDKVDWICNAGHTTKGITEGKANPCGECGQTFDNRLEEFLSVRLRQLSRDAEDKIDVLLRVDREKAPPAVEYTLFLNSLFTSHDIKGHGMQPGPSPLLEP